MEPFKVSFKHKGIQYDGWINPLDNCYPPKLFHVVLNNARMGNLVYHSGWRLDSHPELSLVLGDCVLSWWN